MLAGQSNMFGRGEPLALVSATTPWLRLWRGGRWQVASDPLGPADDPKACIGPAMMFGFQLVRREPGRRSA